MAASALGVLLIALVLLVAVNAATAERRALAFAFAATLLLFLALREAPLAASGARWIGQRWNWTGDFASLGGMLIVAALLVRRAGFAWSDFGIKLRHQRGSLAVALAVMLVALTLNYLVMSLSAFRLRHVPLETWLYQASMPGLVEETAFRGVLLALADRLYPPRWRVGGAGLGWGGLIVSALFALLHPLSLDTLTGIVPAALLYLWLRARTGSLIMPVVAHNGWNLCVYAAHL